LDSASSSNHTPGWHKSWKYNDYVWYYDIYIYDILENIFYLKLF